jgi:predicted ArsR family transcriptional regulator
MTHNELVEALEAASRRPSDDAGFMTTKDLSRELGIGLAAVRVRLQHLADDGRLVVGKIMRPTLGGIDTPVTAYKLVEPPDG